MSKRKVYSDYAGYIAQRINVLTGVPNVIYIAVEQQIDADHKYVTVCEAHSNMINAASIRSARADMADASEWCADCQKLFARSVPVIRFGANTNAEAYIERYMEWYAAGQSNDLRTFPRPSHEMEVRITGTAIRLYVWGSLERIKVQSLKMASHERYSTEPSMRHMKRRHREVVQAAYKAWKFAGQPNQFVYLW
jgi:hypothetical protein